MLHFCYIWWNNQASHSKQKGCAELSSCLWVTAPSSTAGIPPAQTLQIGTEGRRDETQQQFTAVQRPGGTKGTSSVYSGTGTEPSRGCLPSPPSIRALTMAAFPSPVGQRQEARPGNNERPRLESRTVWLFRRKPVNKNRTKASGYFAMMMWNWRGKAENSTGTSSMAGSGRPKLGLSAGRRSRALSAGCANPEPGGPR